MVSKKVPPVKTDKSHAQKYGLKKWSLIYSSIFINFGRWRSSPYFKYDILILVTVIIKAATIFLTTMILALSANVTGTTISQASSAMEINPVLRFLIDAQNAGLVGTVILIPAALLAFYHIAKKALFKEHPLILQFFAWIMFYSVFFNVLHDLGTFIGFLIRWGVIG